MVSKRPDHPTEASARVADAFAVSVRGKTMLAPLGRALRLARIERGWSQEELARRAGADRTYLGCIERGKCNPGVANLIALALALGTTASRLFAEAERLAATSLWGAE